MKHFTGSVSQFTAPALCLAALAAGFTGCGSSTDDTPGSMTDPQTTSTFCSSEDDSPEFTQGLTVVGAANYTFKIVDAAPVKPVLGRNTWTLQVLDPSGEPVGDDAKVSIKCSMPGHTHGCAVEPGITATGDGRYEFEPLIFNMSKHWDVTFNLKVGTINDVAVFPVCIP